MTWTHVCYHLKSFLNLVRNLQAASLSNLCKLGCQNMYPLIYVNIFVLKHHNHFQHFMPTHPPVFVVSKQGVKLGVCIWACQSQYTILDGHLLPDWSPEKKLKKLLLKRNTLHYFSHHVNFNKAQAASKIPACGRKLTSWLRVENY